jgi:nitrite reductase/ring-hydroxylating ferredoxin subunit
MSYEQAEYSAVGWTLAARSSDLEEGSVVGVKVKGLRLALYRLDGRVYATNDVCSHEFALLSEGYVDGDCIECPLHQALFHIPTGAVRSAPAVDAIATYPAKEEGEEVLVQLPE